MSRTCKSTTRATSIPLCGRFDMECTQIEANEALKGKRICMSVALRRHQGKRERHLANAQGMAAYHLHCAVLPIQDIQRSAPHLPLTCTLLATTTTCRMPQATSSTNMPNRLPSTWS